MRTAFVRLLAPLLVGIVLGACGDDHASVGADAGAGTDASVPVPSTELANLVVQDAAGPTTLALTPGFDADTTSYAITVGVAVQSVQLTATTLDADATITVAGAAATSGAAAPPFALALGANALDVVVSRAGLPDRSYTVTVTRALALAQAAYVKSSNTGAQDGFGFRIAIAGDTLVVGARTEDSSATGVGGDQTSNGASNSGAVYVFTRTAGVWTQEAYLKASNAGPSDGFGSSVALSGDTLAVGASFEASAAAGVGGDQSDNSRAGSGAVYVFTRTAGVWTQQAYVKASNPDGNDGFGVNVALDGDTLAVSAPLEASSATGIDGDQTSNGSIFAGAVYVFARSGTTWSQQAYVKASNTSFSNQFGSGLALSGDTLAVGAPGESSSATGVGGSQVNSGALSSGAVYVFTRTGTTWSQQAYVKASNTGSGDVFGGKLALSGDTLAVGALSEDSSSTGIDSTPDDAAAESGAVYVFARVGGVWSQQAYVKASNTETNDLFGSALAVAGDVLVVGAPGESSSATGVDGAQNNDDANHSGAVYVFARRGGVWSQAAYLKASNSEPDDQFGAAVAVSADTAVVSSSDDSAATGIDGDQSDNSSTDSGAVYLFDL